MAHNAAVFSVYVHPVYKPSELRRLGNFNNKGAALASALRAYVSGLHEKDGDRTLEVVRDNLSGDELQLVVKHGQSGVSADIYDKNRKKRLHQNPDDTHEITSGVLFQLPKAQDMGWLAVHVHGNRSPKQILYRALSMRFRAEHELKLVVAPVVSTAMLIQAVEEGKLNSVKLTRLERPTDARKRITQKWVRHDQRARIEVLIRAGSGEHVVGNLVA